MWTTPKARRQEHVRKVCTREIRLRWRWNVLRVHLIYTNKALRDRVYLGVVLWCNRTAIWWTQIQRNIKWTLQYRSETLCEQCVDMGTRTELGKCGSTNIQVQHTVCQVTSQKRKCVPQTTTLVLVLQSEIYSLGVKCQSLFKGETFAFACGSRAYCCLFPTALCKSGFSCHCCARSRAARSGRTRCPVWSRWGRPPWRPRSARRAAAAWCSASPGLGSQTAVQVQRSCPACCPVCVNERSFESTPKDVKIPSSFIRRRFICVAQKFWESLCVVQRLWQNFVFAVSDGSSRQVFFVRILLCMHVKRKLLWCRSEPTWYLASRSLTFFTSFWKEKPVLVHQWLQREFSHKIKEQTTISRFCQATRRIFFVVVLNNKKAPLYRKQWGLWRNERRTRGSQIRAPEKIKRQNR